MLGYDEFIKLGSTDGKVIVTILGHVYGITNWIDVGTDLVYFDGSFDGYNDGKIEVLLLGDSLGYTGVKVCLALMKASNWYLLMVKLLSLYLENRLNHTWA